LSRIQKPAPKYFGGGFYFAHITPNSARIDWENPATLDLRLVDPTRRGVFTFATVEGNMGKIISIG